MYVSGVNRVTKRLRFIGVLFDRSTGFTRSGYIIDCFIVSVTDKMQLQRYSVKSCASLYLPYL